MEGDARRVFGNEAEQPKNKETRKYEDQIVRWLQEHPDISSAQVHDWLKEHYPDYHGKERTLRRYVASLRIKHGIKKSVKVRQYQATEELPMGYQAQVDLGFINLKNTEGQKVKAYWIRASPITQPSKVR